jgi:two-component system chemotaxis response regulator CheB
MEKQVRVMIVDDSALMRHVLRSMLESDPHIRVVGEAENGRDALDRVAGLRPDVITMDVRMPVMDGLETTEHLMAYHPTPILVITASLSKYDIDITFQMLGAGALDVVEKPRSLDQSSHELIRRVKAVARMRVVTHLRGRRRSGAEARPDLRVQPDAAADEGRPRSLKTRTSSLKSRTSSLKSRTGALKLRPGTARAASSTNFPLVVIGASAGGPRIVYQILSLLPPNLRAAVVIVQHIAEGFGAGMAEWLAGAQTLPVHLAQEGMPLAVDRVLVAPDSVDLIIEQSGCVHLSSTPLLQRRPRPSVDLAMQSAADAFGSNTIGVLLTGMGNDGARGMQRIKRAGGFTVAQNEATSPIYGMPRAAVELGAVNLVLPPDEIVGALQQQIANIWTQIASAEAQAGT